MWFWIEQQKRCEKSNLAVVSLHHIFSSLRFCNEEGLVLVNNNCLDDYHLKPFFIKIDVQGFEYEVLLGARKTITSAKPVLLIETPGHKEIDFLSGLGYKSFVCKNNTLYPGSNKRNDFFIHGVMLANFHSASNVQVNALALP